MATRQLRESVADPHNEDADSDYDYMENQESGPVAAVYSATAPTSHTEQHLPALPRKTRNTHDWQPEDPGLYGEKDTTPSPFLSGYCDASAFASTSHAQRCVPSAKRDHP